MRFEILNVDHGFCAYAEGADGNVLLFDCGHGATCRPSHYLFGRDIFTIRRFFVTNYDEDHISDLCAVRQTFTIEALTRNASITASQIRSTKAQPLSTAMTDLLDMIDTFTNPVAPAHLEPNGITVRVFHNNYPTFTDTNNLSLLTFLDVGNLSLVLTGDLEHAGWLELLTNRQVQELLGRVRVFVASHHGRSSGYCREVFDFCNPSLIVMSDGPIHHDTQEMAGVYGQHATGEVFRAASGPEVRRVVTTRRDGHIFWDV